MKKIEAFIQPDKMDSIVDELKRKNVNGISISQVHGFGKQMGWKEHVRGTEVDYNFLPRIKIELIVLDSQLESIVDCITRVAKTGDADDGKIFIYEVADAIRVRTGERGEYAIR